MKPLTDSPSGSELPIVSIGLPVFNGENYLRQAIESILAQTFTRFELIVHDNASTDATQEICEGFAARDSRVRYFRNPTNIGAAKNYDACFEKSHGEYFKWAAHDDLIEPTFLEKTVAALEAEPHATQCVTEIRKIDGNGDPVRFEYRRTLKLDSNDPLKRFAQATGLSHDCVEFFGVFRREALVGSQLHGNFVGSDRVLLAEMSLRGKCVYIREPLFVHREHEQQLSRSMQFDREFAANWWGKNDQPKILNELHRLNVFFKFFGTVRRSYPGKALSRARCYLYLLTWFFRENHAALVASDILWKVSPNIFYRMRRKHREKLQAGDSISQRPKANTGKAVELRKA
ncbi:MAG: glycosyltransferase [Symploca sp. SIO2D2]|nr:glycosyltransferase [Symploca sp. SIO2D2]